MFSSSNDIESIDNDNVVELFNLKEQLQANVLPQICSVVAPILQEAQDQIKYWKQKYEDAKQQLLQESERQKKCSTCQKENIIRAPGSSKKRKHNHNDIQAIVASAAASATRKNKLATAVKVPYQADNHTFSAHTKHVPMYIKQKQPSETKVIEANAPSCTDILSPKPALHPAVDSNQCIKTAKEANQFSSRNTNRVDPNSTHLLNKRSSRQLPIVKKENLNHRRPPRSEEKFKYEEVVRNHAERRSLHGHTCQECDAFARFMLQARDSKGDAIYDLKDIVQACSRHRKRFSQGECTTPEGFWELSFVDSVEKRTNVQNYEAETPENLRFAFEEKSA